MLRADGFRRIAGRFATQDIFTQWNGGTASKTSVTDFLIAPPGLTIFLTIAIGHAFGTLRLGDFSLGSVAGSLFAGVVIGDFSVVPVSGTAKSFLFDLFLVGVGYAVGPQVL